MIVCNLYHCENKTHYYYYYYYYYYYPAMVAQVVKCSVCCTGVVGLTPGQDPCGRQSLGMSSTDGVTLKLCWTCLSIINTRLPYTLLRLSLVSMPSGFEPGPLVTWRAS